MGLCLVGGWLNAVQTPVKWPQTVVMDLWGSKGSKIRWTGHGVHRLESSSPSALPPSQNPLVSDEGSLEPEELDAVPSSGVEDSEREGEREGMAEAEAMLRVDPVAALEMARELAATERRDEFLDQAAAEWGGRDAVAAAGWVRQIENRPLRNRLLGRVAVGMATDFPAAAAQLVANEMEAGGEQDRAVISVIQRWVKSDPLAAAAWVERFPQTPMRGAAVEVLVSGWWKSDPQGVRTWMRGLPERRLQQRVSSVIQRVEISTP